uniref:non-specific serine/threonine protein kinase n=1 Tax=Chromera velia CCMP2878 TaxID=1169474 RepID=A0A0G4GS31_9ALVE|eukprot:Cvel_5127.t1-p1 / transcript=Cvel_5127.t1 / gene=Cvel_5127 / organism=Chromera_velia_CCMP2878 / gene_product=Calcium-dependent protein kinase 1, putative / transcript_product=Calcium-dependent protein kinase 1, putative / location=Cvel_scaffold234:83248-92588(+) / protein_length=663 / sequence_SO=supercontig / SO=protein_coding / is_pseudo=false
MHGQPAYAAYPMYGAGAAYGGAYGMPTGGAYGGAGYAQPVAGYSDQHAQYYGQNVYAQQMQQLQQQPQAAPAQPTAPSEAQLKAVVDCLSSPEKLRASAQSFFSAHDKDGSGELSLDEIGTCIAHIQRKLNLPPTPPSLNVKLVHRFDKSGDGKLDFPEFCALFMALLRRVRDKYADSVTAAVGKQAFTGQKAAGKIQDSYEFVKKLGQGAFGEVFLVTEKSSGRQRVCKTVSKSNAGGTPLDEVKDEIRKLAMLDHPNVLRVFEYFEDYAKLYIIMEPSSGGELFDAIEKKAKTGQRLSEAWVAGVFKQMLEAINYAHTNNIAHKDLKPQNILLGSDSSDDAPSVVVIDWGLAEMFGSTRRGRQIGGTPYYMAPEVWMGNYGYKCDLFSCGVILYQLLTGELPFEGRSIEELQQKILYAEPDWNCLSHVSTEAMTLCRWMLAKQERQRPSAQNALKSQWFQLAAKKVQPLGQRAVDGIKAFAEKDHFQKTALTAVVAQLSTSSLREIKCVTFRCRFCICLFSLFCVCGDAFKEYDDDGNGVLEEVEILGALKKLGVEGDAAKKAVEAMDMDKTGKVTYSEFMAACVSMNADLVESTLWSAFKQFDKDGSGTLSPAEVQQILGGGQLKHMLPGGKSAEQLVSEMSGGRSEISFDNFRQHIMGC